MNLENDIVRTFATQIERNTSAIASLKKSNNILFTLTAVFGLGLAVTGTELYLYEKREDARWYREKHKEQ